MSRRIFDEEHEMFRDSVRNFMRKEIEPHVDKWQEQEIVDREAFEKAGEMGLLLMWADEKYGGAGSIFRTINDAIDRCSVCGTAGQRNGER